MIIVPTWEQSCQFHLGTISSVSVGNKCASLILIYCSFALIYLFFLVFIVLIILFFHNSLFCCFFVFCVLPFSILFKLYAALLNYFFTYFFLLYTCIFILFTIIIWDITRSLNIVCKK